MPRHPKVKKHVPQKIREEFNAHLVEDSFLDLDEKTEWLNRRLSEEGIEVPEGTIGRSAVYGYMRDYQLEFEASMAEGDRMLQLARASLATNQDAEGVLQQASIRTMQTSLLRLSVSLRKLEQAETPDLHAISKTASVLTRAMADIGRLNISTLKWQEEVREKIQAELEAMKQEGNFDGETLDAVQKRVAIYLPDNKR